MVMDKVERNEKLKVLAHYLVEHLHTHNIWAVKIFITEIIYFLNVLLNIYLIDVFLGRQYLCTMRLYLHHIIYLPRWRVQQVWSGSSRHDGGWSWGQDWPHGQNIPTRDQVHLQQVWTRRRPHEERRSLCSPCQHCQWGRNGFKIS